MTDINIHLFGTKKVKLKVRNQINHYDIRDSYSWKEKMKTLRELGYTVRKAELDTYNTKNFEKLVDKELRERLDNTKTSLKEYIDGLNFETKTFLEPDHSQSIWLEYKTYDKYRKFLNDNNFSIEEVEVV